MRKPTGQQQGMKFIAADGSEIPNQCEFDVIFQGADDRVRQVTFQNAKVGLPIFSINGVAQKDHRVWFEHDRGAVVHKPTGQEMPFIARSGVYFIQMRVPRALVRPQGFQRPGSA